MTRGAVFNSLVSYGVLEDARAIDLYAGSGAVGIEAISRGASHVTFVDSSRRATDAIATNVENCRFLEQAQILTADASRIDLAGYDVLFIDPPYQFTDWPTLLARIPAGFVVAESGRTVEPPDGWQELRRQKYGRAWVSFLERE